MSQQTAPSPGAEGEPPPSAQMFDLEWLADHPLEQEHFTGAMQNLAENLALRALSAYKLPAGDVVADIGGADGTILSALLAGDPSTSPCW